METLPPEPPVPAESKFPGIVLAAGIIWIIIGSLILLGMLAVVVLIPILQQGQDAGAALSGVLTIGGCFGLFGLVFLHVGIETVRGRAKDTLGNGIGSIIFGVLFGGVSLNLQSGGAGLALLAAGILALVGRSDYRAWRRSHRARGGSAESDATPDRRGS